MAKAPIEKELKFKGFEDVKAGIVKWPMSVIRISSSDKEKLIELASSARLYYIDRTPYKVTVDGEVVGNVSWDDGEGIWSWLSEQIFIDEDDEESRLKWEYLPDDNIKELLEAAQKDDFIGSFEIEEDFEEE